ncbi:hypothetical protein OG21DRAFT_1135409 [Imleria badia]|nr:hypothetical protein OG21DRAFT_1135409 [Imleria badia]
MSEGTLLEAHVHPVLVPGPALGKCVETCTQVTDTTSDVSTAHRIARLFNVSGAIRESHSETLDFPDLAYICAEVNAVVRGIATTMTTDPAASAREDEEDVEEVDFADLAAIRAKVDTAEHGDPLPLRKTSLTLEDINVMANIVVHHRGAVQDLVKRPRLRT